MVCRIKHHDVGEVARQHARSVSDSVVPARRELSNRFLEQ